MLSLDLRLGSGCLNIIKQNQEKGRTNKFAGLAETVPGPPGKPENAAFCEASYFTQIFI
jgi:hypothetical protein